MSLRISSKSLLCFVAAGLAWSAGGGAAQASEPTRYHLKIASQPLDEALQEFSRQSGIQVIFFSRLTEGLRAPALEGRYTLTSALALMLTDSKLTFRVINPKTIEIREPALHRAQDQSTDPPSLKRGALPRIDGTLTRGSLNEHE